MSVVGFDIAKNVFEVHGVDRRGAGVLRKRFRDWEQRKREWRPSLFLNDKPLSIPSAENGFIRLNRKFHPGDRITLVLPMKTTLSYWPTNGIGIERGPLVFSLPIKED